MGEPPSRTGFCRVMWNAEGPGDTVNEVGTSGEAEGKDREITNVMNEEKNCEICVCMWGVGREQLTLKCYVYRV